MMAGSATVKPSILFDMRKNRIRIHKNTLHALGNPDFVVLIINPDEHTLGIKCSVMDDKLAHRIRQSTMKSKVCYELYSKTLMAALHKLCPDWNDTFNYRVEGEFIAEENIVVFSMRDCTVIGH